MGVSNGRATGDGEEATAAEQTADGDPDETGGADGGAVDDAGPDADDRVDELSLDLVFEILKNERRRYVLQYLTGREERVSLGTLAEHIAARENDTTPDQLTSQERKRVYVGLYQCHLPKMDSADIVDFDKNRGTIEIGPNVGQLDPYLDKPSRSERGWHRYYLSCALVGTVLLATSLSTAALPVAIAAGVTTVGFLVFSIAHAYEYREGALPGGAVGLRWPMLSSRLN